MNNKDNGTMDYGKKMQYQLNIKNIAINEHENTCVIWVLKTFLDII